jgi:hypothetical protein
MKLPHLLAVKAPEAFADLWSAAAGAGLRLGWLELGESEPMPVRLEAAAAAGALRAVRAGGGRVASVKPLRGEPVLRDLVREHFRGCAGVLVRGSALYPKLVVKGQGWAPKRAARGTELTIDGLPRCPVARARSPEPFEGRAFPGPGSASGQAQPSSSAG